MNVFERNRESLRESTAGVLVVVDVVYRTSFNQFQFIRQILCNRTAKVYYNNIYIYNFSRCIENYSYDIYFLLYNYSRNGYIFTARNKDIYKICIKYI